jgi:hypothetical protein
VPQWKHGKGQEVGFGRGERCRNFWGGSVRSS